MRVIHLVRDGRDVAFSDHRGPDNAFWRRIHFDTDRIATWRGLRLTGPAYRRRPHLYNAAHWSNAVRVARALDTGVISVNSNTSVRVQTPFGGFKQSGFGRELGLQAMDGYSELKNVFVAAD